MRDVRIDDKEDRIQRINALHILGTNDQPLIFRGVTQEPDEFINALVHIAQDNMDRLFEIPRHLCDADRRAEAIEVLVVVSHDKDFVGVLHDFTHGMGDDARLDARMLFHRLRLAAEELILAAHAHGDLIAAASEREIKTCLRLPAKLFHRLFLSDGKTHRKRQRQAVRTLQVAHAVEDVEMLLDGAIQSLSLKHGDIEIVAHAPHEAAEPLEPLVKTTVRLKEERRAFRLRKPLHDLIEVVDLDVRKYGAAVLEENPHLLVLRPIFHIKSHKPLDVVRRHDGAVANLVIACFMGKYILARRTPDRLQNDAGPVIFQRKTSLRLLS